MDVPFDSVVDTLFYQTLKKSFPDLLQQASDSQRIICAPIDAALKKVSLDREFLLTHILKPSPYILGEFITMNGHSVEIDDRAIHTKDLPEARTVRILNEETFYSRRGKPYRVLLIEQPLVGTTGRAEGSAPPDTLSQQWPISRTVEESVKRPPKKILLTELHAFRARTLLASLGGDAGGIQEMIETLTTRAKNFARQYVFVRGFERHATSSVQVASFVPFFRTA